MELIKKVYINGVHISDYNNLAVYIDGKLLKNSSMFNIFNKRVLDLNKKSDFSIDYILDILKEEKEDNKNNTINGLQIKNPKEKSIDNTINGLQIKNPKEKRSTDNTINGLQIKNPKINKSSIIINGTLDNSIQTIIKIDGNLITDFTKIELYLNGNKIKNSDIKLIINVNKNNLLKLVRILKK